jgi:hypothetical protein
MIRLPVFSSGRTSKTGSGSRCAMNPIMFRIASDTPTCAALRM